MFIRDSPRHLRIWGAEGLREAAGFDQLITHMQADIERLRTRYGAR